MAKSLQLLVVISAIMTGCVEAEHAAPFGNRRNGEALASQWCSSCHQIAPDQPASSSGAPSFARLAATWRAGELRRFLAEQHLPMPTFRLRPEEREDVIAHILAGRNAK